MNDIMNQLVVELALDLKLEAAENGQGILSFRDLVTATVDALKSEPGFENYNRVIVARALQLA